MRAGEAFHSSECRLERALGLPVRGAHLQAEDGGDRSEVVFDAVLELEQEHFAIGERPPHGAPKHLGERDDEESGGEVDEDARPVRRVFDREAPFDGEHEIPSIERGDRLRDRAGEPASEERRHKHERNGERERSGARQPDVGEKPETYGDGAAKDGEEDLSGDDGQVRARKVGDIQMCQPEHRTTLAIRRGRRLNERCLMHPLKASLYAKKRAP